MIRRTIPPGYLDVDPRTARRIPLWQVLAPGNPLFPGDPPFTARPWATVARDGFAVEQLTSLGTHTGTHVSAPSHAAAAGSPLSDLDEEWTLMPLAVVDVRDRVPKQESSGRLGVDVDDLIAWEQRHGAMPRGGCLLLLTGFADRYRPGGRYDDPAPGLTGRAVGWLFDERGIRAIGSDSFGPDAGDDPAFAATREALGRGGLTIENLGPGLASMRPHGDWIAINGARPRWSGFPVGITGFTLPSANRSE
jgi:kynurenine formamidase